MESELLSERKQAASALSKSDEEFVRSTALNAEKLAMALGLPREAKYAALAAVGSGVADAITNLKESYAPQSERPIVPPVSDEGKAGE